MIPILGDSAGPTLCFLDNPFPLRTRTGCLMNLPTHCIHLLTIFRRDLHRVAVKLLFEWFFNCLWVVRFYWSISALAWEQIFWLFIRIRLNLSICTRLDFYTRFGL